MALCRFNQGSCWRTRLSNDSEQNFDASTRGHAAATACEQSLRVLEQRGYPVRRVRGFAAHGLKDLEAVLAELIRGK